MSGAVGAVSEVVLHAHDSIILGRSDLSHSALFICLYLNLRYLGLCDNRVLDSEYLVLGNRLLLYYPVRYLILHSQAFLMLSIVIVIVVLN